ncbi:rac GTPase-activating protein 1 isoform X2 [Nematostella vectensis]|uniref:rac GTPase-activating protein 1 isoform X2 n=1 Tax=Nematostella vectensis TaxID=45351 RepID=UPI00138FF0B5|nr:rac GTPase-activating protein 1 isoform X2 [Nematostella vectensis]
MRHSNMSVAALVSSFDDIIRSAAVLSEGIEGEFIKFVTQQEECRKKWLEADNSTAKLRQDNAKLKAENDALQVKLKHARNQIEIEIKRRMKAEASQDHLERQVALIRELLMDKETMSRLNENERQTLMQSIQMSHIIAEDRNSPRKRPYGIDESSASILSPSDISYDTTADDLDEPYNAGRPVYGKAQEEGTPPKKMKTAEHRMENEVVVAGTKVTVSPDGPIKVSAYISPCKQQPSPVKLLPTIRPEDINDTGLPKSNLYPALPRTPSVRSNVEYIGSANNHNNHTGKRKKYGQDNDQIIVKTGRRKKSHIFCSKTVIKPESCQPCGKRIKFGKLALKCKDCRAVCHPDCKDNVPLPCIPSNLTPGSGHRRQEETLEFYTPNTSPMVPAIVVQCISEIEKRGLNEVGLYRVPGAERSIKELKDKFLHGKTQNLHETIDIHVVCGVLKDFLRNLAEPLVTYHLWGAFVNAANKDDDQDSFSAMYQAVSELPQANRDTLACLVVHLQKVSQCTDCKMPVSNLARVFGPTLVGHSSPNVEPVDMLQQTKLQPRVVERLLAMPVDYWNQFLKSDDIRSPPYNPATHRTDGTPLTPECRPVPQSMLGPLPTPGRTQSVKKKGSFLSRTPITPRFGSKSKHPNKRPTHFFSSPMLK